MPNQAVDKGSTLIEAVDKAIEIFMQMEDQYKDISGWQSEKVHQQYRNAIVTSMWTNKSSFYEHLHPLIIAHVKKLLHETIFHPSKILMRMDMAGGTLSMEGLELF